MALKRVELVRERLVRGFSAEVVRLRSWLSMIEGNGEAVELLRSREGEQLVIDLIDMTLAHLGHVTEAVGGDANSATKRVVRRGKNDQAERRVNARSEVVNAE